MLLYLENKDHTEIADILGISKSNVGTKIGRIKEKMKTQFS
jgi:RNA polymerase sigma-70 factor (ECF subfamily)